MIYHTMSYFLISFSTLISYKNLSYYDNIIINLCHHCTVLKNSVSCEVGKFVDFQKGSYMYILSLCLYMYTFMSLNSTIHGIEILYQTARIMGSSNKIMQAFV